MHNNKITRLYEIDYRTGKILCNVQKSPGSEFWTVDGRAEIEEDHSFYCNPIKLSEKFANEEDAKNKLTELAKSWIDATLREL